MKELAKALNLGFTICINIGLPILFGYYIDKYFSISPIGIIIGTLLGVSLAFYTLYQLTNKV